jgi:hypothetical protein
MSECPCDWCDGTGKDQNEPCGACGGTGKKRPRCSVCGGEWAVEGKATCAAWECQREHTAELQQRRRRKVFGDRLELRREESGWRHYLGGEPVHCGSGLELYADDRNNPDTYLRGRYEANLATSGGEPTVWFCTAVGEVRVNVHLAHFRWPGRSSGTMRRPGTCPVCGAAGPGVGPHGRCPVLGCAGAIA